MKSFISILSATAVFGFLILAGCMKDPNLDNTVPVNTDITFHVPEGWPAPKYAFEGNTLTNEGFELGRKLFFDPLLSRDNTISCGSCHQPFAAFAQLGHDVSHGVDDLLGTRNSPALFNLNWHEGFFWDGGVNHIEVQPLSPIQNPVEMDEKMDNVIKKLQASTQYKDMYKAAFGDETINTQRTFKALAQFMGALVSANSKYDKYKRNEATLTATENAGLQVFNDKCASCHTAPLFSDFTYRNNGLKPFAINDSGRGRITMDPADMHKFKVPSLRNLKYTPPYMHDGRFNSLEQVLDYYASGIHQSPTLDPLLKNGIQLTAEERENLLQFLNTLNDEEFVKNPRFQEPAND